MRYHQDGRKRDVLLLVWLMLLLPATSWVPSATRTVFLHPSITHQTLLAASVQEQPVLNTSALFLNDLYRVQKPLQLDDDGLDRHNAPIILENDPDGAQRLLKMMAQWQARTVDTIPDAAYELVLETFVRRGRLRWNHDETMLVCSADVLPYFFGSIPAPTIRMYELYVECLAICSTPRGQRQYAETAHEVVQSAPAPTATMWLHTIHAYCWQQPNRCPGTHAETAQQLYRDHLQDRASMDIQICAKTYLLEAFSKALNAANVCEGILEFLQQHNGTTAETYSNVILAWSKQAQTISDRHAAQRAHDLLLEQIKVHEPTLIAFNAVVAGWGRLQRPDQTKRILQMMEDIVDQYEFLQPDTVFYNSIMHGMLTHTNRRQALEDILEVYDKVEQPNAFTFHTLMKAYKQTPNHKQYLNELIGLLDQLELQWFENFDKSTEPHNRVYNLVLDSYAKWGDAKPALELLQHMKGLPHGDCHPDIISYTTVMECLAKSKLVNAPDLALDLLEELKETYRNSKKMTHRPNLRTYTMVIQTLASAQGYVQKAYELLEELEEAYEKTQHPSLQLNTYPYNYVLNCAANAMSDKMQAFAIATKTYKRLGECRDSYSYAFWLKCGNNLLDPVLRAKVTRQAFQEAKARGLVNDPILHRLFQGSPPELVEELLEGVSSQASVTIKDLPREWSCNLQR